LSSHKSRGSIKFRECNRNYQGRLESDQKSHKEPIPSILKQSSKSKKITVKVAKPVTQAKSYRQKNKKGDK